MPMLATCPWVSSFSFLCLGSCLSALYASALLLEWQVGQCWWREQDGSLTVWSCSGLVTCVTWGQAAHLSEPRAPSLSDGLSEQPSSGLR